MRRLLVAAAVTVVLGFLSGPARAAAPTPDARAFEVVNAATGGVLAARNAHEQLPIASLTKLMTVIVALQHLQVDQVVTVSKRIIHAGGSRIPLRARLLVHVVPADSRVVERVVAPSDVRLPVAKGRLLGTIEVRVGGQLLGVRPLVAARSVKRPGLGGRLRWYATRTVHNFLRLF
jgi:D-alanyl-D-alanine carboxypeptidase